MRIALALILVVGLTATANADVYSWFTLEADAASAAAYKGMDLNIVHPVCPGAPETYTIHQWLETSEDLALSGINSDVEFNGDMSINPSTFINDVGVGMMGQWMSEDVVTVDGTGAWGYGRYYFMGAPYESYITAADGVQHVASFDLTINHAGMPEVQTLLAGIGVQGWASTPPVGFNVFFGDDTVGIMNSDKFTMTEVVTVTCLPEPATIALLGFGALALIRRR